MRLRSIALLLALGCAGIAYPATLWNWSYSRSPIVASGTFTTVDTPDGTGGYLITAISGQRGGIAITGLQTTGTAIPGNEPFAVDNLIYLSPAPAFTVHGVGFSLADGSYANLFYADFLPTPVMTEVLSLAPFVPGSLGAEDSELPIRFEASQVPEPMPMTLTLAGLLVLAAGRRRRK